MSAALEYEDYPKVLKYLRVLRDKYDTDVETLVGLEGFEGFMKSESYRELLKDK